MAAVVAHGVLWAMAAQGLEQRVLQPWALAAGAVQMWLWLVLLTAGCSEPAHLCTLQGAFQLNPSP